MTRSIFPAEREVVIGVRLAGEQSATFEVISMTLITRRPFNLFNELQRDMNRLFDTRVLGSQDNLLEFNKDWIPAVDIHEDAKGYHLSIDLPGMKPEQIEVTANDGVLSIRGERETINEDKELKRSERMYGSFLREFSMPDNANLNAIDAKSNNGVLQLFVPKLAKAEPKRITVS